MATGGIWILHYEKAKALSVPPVTAFENAFCLDTCQRRIWIFLSELSSPSQLRGHAVEGVFEGQVLEDQAAYSLLLRILTGLESRIVGETDVFGQFKNAWNEFLAQNDSLAKKFAPTIRNLYEDVKEIRSKWLQNIGGNSYGTLVRKLFKEKGLQAEDSILMVGAGLMAESVGPYFKDHELLVYNRSAVRCGRFLEYLNLKRSVPAQAVELGDLSRIRFVVMAVPAGTELDTIIAQSLHPEAVVIHMGTLKGVDCQMKGVSGLFSLKDLFGAQEDLGALREKRIDLARKACSERAVHRSLGSHLSVPHGWEYLALFA